MKNREFGESLIRCTDCPIQEGRLCTPYKSGASKLVYNLLLPPIGLRKYREPYEELETIEDCLRKLREQCNKIIQKQLV